MGKNLQRGRCPICQEPMTGLARLAQLTNTSSLERFTTDPPGALPDDTVDVTWLVDPCWHTLTTSIEVWDAVIDLGWGDDVAAAVNAPIARQLAA